MTRLLYNINHCKFMTLKKFPQVVGLILLGLGTYLLIALIKSDVTEKGSKIFSILVIVSGSLIFLISWAGCWGAMKEHKCLLYSYGAIVGGLAIFQLILAFCLIGIIGKNSGIVRDEMITSMKRYPFYKRDDEKKIAIDELQWHLSCCGWEKGPEDWKENFKNYTDELPRSCCFDPDDEEEQKEQMHNAPEKLCTLKTEGHFKKGCAVEFERLFVLVIFIIFGFLAAVALIQLVAGCFACTLGAAVA
ncbi:CD63 antigen-like protein [Dinothrombium tinctorium]|uniref:Tetraspanin n=1 Tax=Dinothrombium tinctorium TaxID=1965070 RepID=A0A3S3QCJ4_9ACAR|nr:CD63 antigen-like protein [Dinothrombium tinctorium]